MTWQQKRGFPHLPQWLLNGSQKLCRCKHPARTLGHWEPSCWDISHWSQHMLISAHRGVPTTPKARLIPADHRPPGLSVRKNASNGTLPVEMEAVCLRVCVSCAGSRLGDLAAEWCAVCLCACVCVRVCCALCLNFSTEALPDVELLRIAEGGAARLCF